MALEVWKQMKQKQFAPLYLLYGPEPFIIKKTLSTLMEHALEESEVEFNVSNFDLEETPIHIALEEAETFPFMGERKLVILHNPYFLTAEKTKEKVEHNIQLLLDYVENPSPFSIVVIAATYEKLDERKKITKQLKHHATVVEANKLKDQELVRWIEGQAIAHGVQIEREAIQTLMETAGQNLLLLANEIEKMALYVLEEKMITVQTVNELASKSLEQNIFTLIDFIMNRRTSQAIQLLQSLLRQNEEPIKVLALMASQVRIMYVAKSLSQNGYGQQKIATHLKIHPFRVKLAMEKARYFQEKELMTFLNNIADADYKMKTGQMDKALLLELIILQSGSRVSN
ncbi:DNA polymerase III subunit delta [Bacillus sp. JJ722]|uniref:DNA polymerase III subunit delta n=1 Tax=Bacillus sp. JJ722 TaxID=3122973 RepID=UPI0030000557